MSRIVLVTGATSGYGLATAKKFKAEGDTVLIASRNAAKVEAAVKEYGFDKGYTLDVTKFEEWVDLKEKIMAELEIIRAEAKANLEETV